MYLQVDEYGREVYKLVKQFNNMARKEKDMKEKASKDTVRRKKQDTQEDDGGDVFAPLKVAQAIQNQIKDFKVLYYLKLPVTLAPDNSSFYYLKLHSLVSYYTFVALLNLNILIMRVDETFCKKNCGLVYA